MVDGGPFAVCTRCMLSYVARRRVCDQSAIAHASLDSGECVRFIRLGHIFYSMRRNIKGMIYGMW